MTAAALFGLAYHAGGLGDFVLSLPALLRLHGERPELRWKLWGPAERLALLPGWQAAPPELLRGSHTLWGRRPDPAAAAVLREAGRLAAFAAEAPPWLGLASGGGCFVATYPTTTRQWVPAYQRRQLDRCGVRPAEPHVLRRWRQTVLPAPLPERRWLLLHSGSGDPRKNLPSTTWAAAVAELARCTGLEPRVLSGPVEQEAGSEVAVPGAGVSRCTRLAQLLQVLGRTGLFLGNDSGVTHLSGILGIPTVAVFGPTDSRVWRPLGPRVAAVRSDRGCAPCRTRPPISCAERDCLRELPPAAVVSAALGLLARE